MKKIYLVVIIIFSSLLISAQNFKGKVLDNESGKPLSGVNIKVIDSNQGTISNSEGIFHLSLKSRITKIKISYTGYKAIETTLDLNN